MSRQRYDSHFCFILNALIGASIALMLTGCAGQIRKKVISVFFDTTKAPPPTRRIRRDLIQEIELLKRQLAETQQALKEAKGGSVMPERVAVVSALALPIEKTTKWDEAREMLPKDKAGNVDWVQALSARTIRPRSSLNAQDPDLSIFDFDVVMATSGKKGFGVTFSHASHTGWLNCRNCHPGVFPIKSSFEADQSEKRKEPMVVTMSKIRQGEYCGVCHGSVAFGVEGSCMRCHTSSPSQAHWHSAQVPNKPIESVHKWEEARLMLPAASDGEVDWTSALTRAVIAPRPGIDSKAVDEPIISSDIVRVPDGMEDYSVIFPHSPHTALLKCVNCHPSPFTMKAGETAMSMDQINSGEFCGSCHGTVAFSLSSCARCHTKIEGGP